MDGRSRPHVRQGDAHDGGHGSHDLWVAEHVRVVHDDSHRTVPVPQGRGPARADRRQCDPSPIVVDVVVCVGEEVADLDRRVTEHPCQRVPRRAGCAGRSEVDDHPGDHRIPEATAALSFVHRDRRPDHRRVIRPQHERVDMDRHDAQHRSDREHAKDRAGRRQCGGTRQSHGTSRTVPDADRDDQGREHEDERHVVAQAQRRHDRRHVRGPHEHASRPPPQPAGGVREQQVHQRPAVPQHSGGRDAAGEPGDPRRGHQRADAAVGPRRGDAQQQEGAADDDVADRVGVHVRQCQHRRHGGDWRSAVITARTRRW
jgi:hypothetical protein